MKNGWPNAGKWGFTLINCSGILCWPLPSFSETGVTLTAGYNHLRRQELSLGRGGNGLTGFLAGSGGCTSQDADSIFRSQYEPVFAEPVWSQPAAQQIFRAGEMGDRVGW